MTNSSFMRDIQVDAGMKLKNSQQEFLNGSQIRTVCLRRPPRIQPLNMKNVKTNNFGFSIRGGKEHGIAFFITNVVKHSVAEQSGLKIGDQILEMNGFNIDNSLHKEIVQLISNQNKIVMKVQNMGVLPVQNLEQNFISFCNIAETTARAQQKAIICAQTVNGRNSSTIHIKSVEDSKIPTPINKSMGQNKTVIKLVANPVPAPPSTVVSEQATMLKTAKTSTTLSDAISQELKKREQKQNRSMPRPQANSHVQDSSKPVSNKKVDNVHNALLDEFKRVHQRLISNESKKD